MSYTSSTDPGAKSLAVAAVFPALVIAIEFVSGLCAGGFFDPVPTIGHVLLAAAVPAVNVLLWRRMRRDDIGHGADGLSLTVAGGAAMAIAGTYTLLFLPMLPFAAVGILFFGVGLLPFAPVFAFAFAWRWTRAIGGSRWRPVAGGFALGIAALTLVDLPTSATYIALGRYGGDADDRQSAVGLMRRLGDRDMLLRLAYGDTARATGLVSVMLSWWSHGPWGAGIAPTGQARELYYRVTGDAFNAVARPGDGPGNRMRLFAWDEDRGGEAVGGRVPDLSLAGSRIDGSVAARDNLAYVEWTLDMANAGAMAQEARLTLALPDGAVASRATLWVNGEPREASIAGRAAVRAAYESVVRQSRDPLLVTTDGAGRLLVQAFPIEAHGAMKLRIGFTAPLVIAPDGRRTLALPAIVERNFDIADDLRHSIWVEADAPIASGDAALSAHGGMLRGRVTDADLTAHRPRIMLPRVTAAWTASGGIAAAGKAPRIVVQQRIERGDAARPSALMLVLDGSAGNAAAGVALGKAIDAIPAGVPTGLVIAADAPVTIAPASWSAGQRRRVRAAIDGVRYVGGQDDRAALATALSLSADKRATLLWVHGAQPVAFSQAEPDLDQALERLPALPSLVRYQGQAGRAFAGEGRRWFADARMVTPTGDPVADLRSTLADVTGGPGWMVRRTQIDAPVDGSANLVRLWAAERIGEATGRTGKPHDDAVALAHRLNLVTPVSGAVVLATDVEYKANGLPVPSPDDVPTVPEPGIWALLVILAAAAGWSIRRQRAGVTA